jgi:hypothetical protein
VFGYIYYPGWFIYGCTVTFFIPPHFLWHDPKVQT